MAENNAGRLRGQRSPARQSVRRWRFRQRDQSDDHEAPAPAASQIHDPRRTGKMQAISRSQTLKSVRALHEFIPKASPPLGRVGCGLRQCSDVQATRIVAANLHGKRVVESEAWPQRQPQVFFVFVLYSPVNLSPVPVGLLLQNRAQCSAGVFRINVDAPSQQRWF